MFNIPMRRCTHSQHREYTKDMLFGYWACNITLLPRHNQPLQPRYLLPKNGKIPLSKLKV
jgi:hypothetical protein